MKACAHENLIVVDCVHLHALCGVHRHYPDTRLPSFPSLPFHLQRFCGVHRHYTQTCVLRCPPPLFAVSTAILLILALCSLNAPADVGPHSFLQCSGAPWRVMQGDLEDRTFWTAECPWPRCMTRVVDAPPWDACQSLVQHVKFQHGLTYEVSHQSTWFAVTTAHRHTHTLTHTHTTRVRSLRLLLAVASNVRKVSTQPLECLMEKRSCRGIPWKDDCRSRSSSTRRDQ